MAFRMKLDVLLASFRTAPMLLDGPTGTELERRGYRTSLPLWTALAVKEAPTLLRAVHDDYVRAGADILTACTFRTNRYTLAKQGLGRDAVTLTRESVAIARQSASAAARPVLVAGCIAPLEDCYRPELTPDDAALASAHAAHVEALVLAGVDLLLVETMPTLREARIATRAAIATGLAVMTSLLVGPDRTMFDGTRLAQAFEELAELAVNCGPMNWCTQAIEDLAATRRCFGAYANSGAPSPTFGFTPAALDVDGYARCAAAWIGAGASLVGGCCGTGPDHIAALRRILDGARTSACDRSAS